MARHLHHRHYEHQTRSPAANVAPSPQQAQLRAIIETPLSHVKSLFIRSSSGSGYSSDGTDPEPVGGESSDSSSSSSSSGGQKQGNNISLPVALGVIIPVALAVIIFVFLHRRHVKKLRQEDANDPHKSLDFGWDPSNETMANKRGKSRKGKPEVVVPEFGMEKPSGKERGVSMDLDVGSPYLMPPGLQGSKESLHSMSRTIHSHDDRYRPATTYNPNDNSSLHSSHTKRAGDDSSSFATSGSTKRGPRDEMRQDLLGNAQRMSRSIPPANHGSVPQIQMPEPIQEMPRKPLPSNLATPSSAGLAPAAGADPRDSYQVGDDLRKSNNYLGAYIHSRDPSMDARSPESEKSQYATPQELPSSPAIGLQNTDNRKSPPPAITTLASPARTPRQQSLRSSKQASIEQNFYDDSSDYGEAVKVTPASPHGSQHDLHSNNRGSSQEYMPPIDEHSLGVDESDFGYDVRRMSTGVRPLPPDDPHDNPEQRANRIRSFYKEYFDDSKPAPAGADYYEDYDENYVGDGAISDPASGQFVMTGEVPGAEPYRRRAMTPPPRVGGRRHAASMSGSSRLMPPGPRAYSSASGRFGPPGPGRGPPKKKMPPPQALRVLPTPHLLKEDAFALPIDFAPPTSAKDRQAGRPESPRGGMRPYSPAVQPHTPLARSYDDLAVMPSPHLLRKSGTFTALDFAPPPRFKNDDTASDAGSIRSNRSAMSARSQHAVRAGAYRVSRIPKEVVGTRNDLMDSLKPQWSMHNNTGTIGMPNK